MVQCLKHKNRKKVQNYTTPIPKKLSKITDKLINPSLIRKLDLLSNLIANWKVILKDDSFWSKPKRLDFYDDEKINGEITISIFNGRGPEAVAKSEEAARIASELADKVEEQNAAQFAADQAAQSIHWVDDSVVAYAGTAFDAPQYYATPESYNIDSSICSGIAAQLMAINGP